jgi:uncharacterized membrane protein YjjP (DUF1212 family)
VAPNSTMSAGDGPDPVNVDLAYDAIAAATALLHSNGQTTSVTATAVRRLDAGLGVSLELIPGWASSQLTTRGRVRRVVAAEPAGINMRRVAAAMKAIDRGRDHPLDSAAISRELDGAARLPASNIFLFALGCATGASALSVIFGVGDLRAVGLLAASAALGGFVRRGLGRLGIGIFVQAFVAATIAGAVGAAAVALDWSSAARLIAVAPAMVLVPGPHILNGAMDLAGMRISLGLARLTYASVILLAIGAGLILGLHLGGTGLPIEPASQPVPLWADIIAAAVAAASYPLYWSTPYNIIFWPAIVGAIAHGFHWWSLNVWHLDIATSALISCAVVGIALTPIAYRLRIPFAAIGFASVVALVPGVYVFRLLSGIIQTVSGSTSGFLPAATNGLTALLIVLAMTVGLVVPRQIGERLRDRSGMRRS